MLDYAIKILIGEKLKYLGIILALSFASFIITQQAAIFVGLMSRTYGFITDTSQPNIWVMDPKVQFVDDIKPLKDTDLYRVRGVEGVEWAVPLYKGLIRARLDNGTFQNCNVIGIDNGTLIGGPPIMLDGKLQDLRQVDAIIVNRVGADNKLATETNGDKYKIPLQTGQVIELNDHRAVVTGICKVTRTFQSQPVIYTTFNRATTYAPPERKLLSFILTHSKKNEDLIEVCRNITEQTGLAAYTPQQFKRLTIKYYLTNTGIPLNFGVAVILGFIIGTAIAGQTFYNFILDNLRYLAVFKAMGASSKLLVKMTLVQVAWVGSIGWGLGTGGAALFGFLSRNSDLSFKLPWELYLFSGIAMIFICLFSSIMSLWKIFKVEPAIVFRT